jgi:23S rRNA pseudouridine955/2504/2580 synthase
VQWLTVDERGEGQRLDNFVLRHMPAVPKTRLYRAMRKGEIRVNKRRAKPEQRLALGDEVRLPPLATPAPGPKAVAPPGWQERIADAVVYEDEQLLAINKPSGLAVHGGSGLDFGLIETLRTMRPKDRYLELVHRLDRETSGLILVARRPAALREMHRLLRDRGVVEKRYVALVSGRWPRALRSVEAPLQKRERSSGERIVHVAQGGKTSLTEFRILEQFSRCTLVEAMPITGRTHQIRVHAQHARHPILGDDKYYDATSRDLAVALGAKRLFLHARALRFRLGDRDYDLQAALGPELETVLEVASKFM